MTTFGIRFLDHLAPARTLIEWAVLAEKKGFDFCWFPHDTFCKNSWVMTVAAAMRTARIKIGSVGTGPYLLDPSEIATYIATLDELSGGRAVLGLGLHTVDMAAWVGIDGTNVIQRTREAIHLVHSLLRGETVAFQGEEYRWTDQCYLRFKPLRADVPIYGCGFGEEYLALTGETCEGSLPMITPPESAPRMVAAIRRGVAAAGRPLDSVDIAGCGWFSVAEDARAAQDAVRRIVAYFGPYLEEEALNSIDLSVNDFAPLRERVEAGDYDGASALVTDRMLDLAIVGTPKQILPRMEALVEAGITQISVGGPLGPDPRRTIELLGDHVLPHFR